MCTWLWNIFQTTCLIYNIFGDYFYSLTVNIGTVMLVTLLAAWPSHVHSGATQTLLFFILQIIICFSYYLLIECQQLLPSCHHLQVVQASPCLLSHPEDKNSVSYEPERDNSSVLTGLHIKFSCVPLSWSRGENGSIHRCFWNMWPVLFIGCR